MMRVTVIDRNPGLREILQVILGGLPEARIGEHNGAEIEGYPRVVPQVVEDAPTNSFTILEPVAYETGKFLFFTWEARVAARVLASVVLHYGESESDFPTKIEITAYGEDAKETVQKMATAIANLGYEVVLTVLSTVRFEDYASD